MTDILHRIVEKKREEVAALKVALPLAELLQRMPQMPPTRDFRAALDASDCAIIAEVKRSSPSKGRLVEDFRPVEQALQYERGGAAAISVLTEKDFFEGDARYLTEIKAAVGIPVLRKDFIVESYQIYEARIIGADAILLIASLLSEAVLREFIGIASALGLAQLVEVHDRPDLDKALAAGAQIIGINNRNLKTFVTDLQTTMDLLPVIPEGRIVVSESGIQTRSDIETLNAAGVRAFLIGETLMRSGRVEETMRGLMGL